MQALRKKGNVEEKISINLEKIVKFKKICKKVKKHIKVCNNVEGKD